MVHTRDVIKVLFDTRPICQTEEETTWPVPACIMTHRTDEVTSYEESSRRGEVATPRLAAPPAH